VGGVDDDNAKEEEEEEEETRDGFGRGGGATTLFDIDIFQQPASQVTKETSEIKQPFLFLFPYSLSISVYRETLVKVTAHRGLPPLSAVSHREDPQTPCLEALILLMPSLLVV